MFPAKPEAQFDGANGALLAPLREALRPEPLPPALADWIRTDWQSRSMPVRRLRLRPFHLLGTAAAAALIIAVLLQAGLSGRTSQSVAVALSPDEAAAIVAAFGTIVWESPTDYSLDVVNASLDDIEGALRGETDSATLLPWGSDDDWDIPAATDEGASRSQTLPRGFVLAARDRGGHS
ncbi:MAG: hypothetical protein KKI02_12240 [Planctomycetes bacterium]|nr:hypothetical protein [Planctomycetota bacterium]